MATLDQLPAEQRAIVELVVQRGRSYDALADVLQVPAERVRELARDALGELSPRTARRVDPEWRGKVADYLLGQQSAADARATRDHLKQSESSRAWALSLLDSLDPLYGDGSPPAVPEGDDDVPVDEPEAKPVVARKPKAAGNGAAAAGETVEERTRARQRERERDRERPAKADRDAEDEPEAKPARKKEPLRKTEERERSGSLSPAAQDALRTRRKRGALAGVVVLALIVVAILAITGTFSSDDSSGSSSGSSTTAAGGTPTTAAANPLQLLGQIVLAPLNGSKAQGIVYLAQENKQRFLVVQAQVPPLPKSQKVAAYEVWLYNTNADAKSLGAQYTDAKGLLQGRANLPANYARYKFIDISREVVSDNNAGHGNASVLRGAFASIKAVPQQQQGTSTTPGAGAGAAPTPGATPTTPAP